MGRSQLKDIFQVVINTARDPLGPFAAVAFQLLIDINKTAGVDDIIGSIQNAAFAQNFGMLRACQLVIGGTGDDLGLEPVHRFVVDDGAQGGR